MIYKVVLTFESVDDTLKCDPSHEQFMHKIKGILTYKGLDEIFVCYNNLYPSAFSCRVFRNVFE